MTTIAGIEIPDAIYNSLTNVVQTEQSVLKSNPAIASLCNPLFQAFLPTGVGPLLCYDAKMLTSYLVQKLANMVTNTEQQVVQQEQQAQAQGQQVTGITFTFTGENFLALTLKSMTIIQNPLENWTISQLTNLEMQALQAGVNQFNSTTLSTINQQLLPEGWALNPLSLSYNSNTDTFVITATYQKLHSPDPQAWMILAIIIILAVVALTYIITNYLIQTQNIQYQKTIAQNAYQLYEQCLQDTNNNIQLCQQLMNDYLKETQPSSSTTTDILIGIGIAASLVGLGILVYDYGKRGNNSVLGKAKNALSGG